MNWCYENGFMCDILSLKLARKACSGMNLLKNSYCDGMKFPVIWYELSMVKCLVVWCRLEQWPHNDAVLHLIQPSIVYVILKRWKGIKPIYCCQGMMQSDVILVITSLLVNTIGCIYWSFPSLIYKTCTDSH